MSVARDAAGSSTTSAVSPTGSSGVTRCLEEISADEVARVRALHVRPCVHDRVPAHANWRIGLVQRGLCVGGALAVGDDLVQGELDAAVAGARAKVNMR